MRHGQSRATRIPVGNRPRAGTGRTARRAAVLVAASALLAVAVPAANASGTARASGAADEARATQRTTAAHRATGAPNGCDAARTALGRSLDTLVTRHGIPGVAAEVIGRDCGRWTAERGVADLDTGRPMRAADRLRIGSVTKTFTATVVVQLADEGRIGLDDPVERHLPGLIRGNGHDGRTITVRQLLQHTSGLPDHVEAIVARPVEEWRLRHFEPRELVATALAMPRPATGWSYSTTNYVVAGLIVEKVTGHGVEAEVRRRIIEPLGLRDTYWPGDHTRIRGPHSRSYFPAVGPAETARPGGTPLADGTEWNMSLGGAGGALVSTPGDVNRFFRGLFGGRLVSAHGLAEMKRTVPVDPERLWPGARYGLGLIASPLTCGGMWWGHGGTVPGGHRALGAIGPDGRGIALALNKVPDSQEAEADFLAAVDAGLCPADRAPHASSTDSTNGTESTTGTDSTNGTESTTSTNSNGTDQLRETE
ncbi:serine hydrolase domain-containing protein [Streptomyces sp. CB01580]|uniref:serine hydrolase domain-containing protein n=1 Tax=Streptomyces sp. CB01580 TaxID=1703933 RepID=UPI001F5B52B7|nr:serine hydrolase domain-containing protein [Streptomyces sp. CB01580]